MAIGTVALLGDLSLDQVLLKALAAEFGWVVSQADNLGVLRQMSDGRNVVAVVFSARHLGVSWQDALESVLAASPRALPIVCSGFSESVPWSDLADAGAFHELRMPLDPGEARRSLGFIWAARKGDAAEEQTAPAPIQTPCANSRSLSFAATS